MALTRINNQALTNVTSAGLPSGSVLQVKSSTQDTWQAMTPSFTDISGLSVTITPRDSNSKFLIMVTLQNIGGSDANISFFKLLRGSTVVVKNENGGGADNNDAFYSAGGQQFTSQNRQTDSPTLTYLDSPASTSALTYKVQFKESGGSHYLNRWALNTDKGGVSTITVMEIAG